MSQLAQTTLFDYNALDLETRIVVQQRTTEIKGLMKRAAQDIIEIGQKLIEVKARLERGKFGNWLKTEFGWSWDTADRFINVAYRFANFPQIAEFAPSALYLLSAPSAPEEARIELLDRASQGEVISYSIAKETLQFYKDENIKSKTDIFISALTPEPDGNYPDAHAEQAEREHEFAESIVSYIPPTQPQPMQLLTSSKNDAWRTPLQYIEAAREVMGGIDLDPASSFTANQTVDANQYFDSEVDGLKLEWFGRIWLNPPYGKTNGKSNQGLFAHKLVTEYNRGNVSQGILLVNLYPGYGWFAPLRERPWCIADHRISFIDPETNEEGDEAKASSVFIYFGKDPAKFYQVFSRFGVCCQPKYYR